MTSSQRILVRAIAAVFLGATLANALVVVPKPSFQRGIGPCPLVGMAGPQQQLPLRIKNVHPTVDMTTTALRSNSDEGSGDETNTETREDDDESEEEGSLFDKINNFLDTPILDANNRSDQGAVAETLKEFVRDEPEIAQVTFSVVVVAILALATKTIMSL